MTCELFQTEMYKQRPGESLPSGREFQEHLQTCPACAREYASMVERDAVIRQTIQRIQAPASLEGMVRSGLSVERAASRTTRRGWPRWLGGLLIPIAAMLLIVVTLVVRGEWRSHQVAQVAARLLRQTPALQFESDQRDAILAWSGQRLPASETLPKRLARVQFRGASTVQQGTHSAVLLRMKHEPRASLLILGDSMAHEGRIALQSASDGSFASWSEGKKTYVVLFHGNTTELKTYMESMGIMA